MTPRPFPLPLSIGTDICQISRIHAILATRRRTRFINRVLGPEEVLESRLLNDLHGPSCGPSWRVASFVAGRFAAKEAAIKAHPLRKLTFHDILISAQAGPPVATIKRPEGGDTSALISISHDGDYATAVCVVAW